MRYTAIVESVLHRKGECMELQERVQNGIALLDEEAPGWESKIDLEILDIGDCHHCVLGQLYGRFTVGLTKLSMPEDGDEPDDCGFDSPRWEAPELTSAWKTAIEARRKEVQPQTK